MCDLKNSICECFKELFLVVLDIEEIVLYFNSLREMKKKFFYEVRYFRWKSIYMKIVVNTN